jgi:hypothetical protein
MQPLPRGEQRRTARRIVAYLPRQSSASAQTGLQGAKQEPSPAFGKSPFRLMASIADPTRGPGPCALSFCDSELLLDPRIA